MVTCPICGEQIEEGLDTCPYCNEHIGNNSLVPKVEADSSHTEIIQPLVPVEAAEKKNGTTSGKQIPWGCGIVALIYGSIILIILLIAHFTIPSEERQKESIIEDVRDCVKDKTESVGNLFGNGLGSLASLFMSSGLTNDALDRAFYENNTIRIDEHWFWSVGKIVNSDYPEGTKASLGIFGFVIPYVSWDDFRLINNTNDNKSSSSDNNTANESSEEDNVVLSDDETQNVTKSSNDGNLENRHADLRKKSVSNTHEAISKMGKEDDDKESVSSENDDSNSSSTGFHFEKADEKVQREMEKAHNK